MSTCMEALLLYLILFLPGMFSSRTYPEIIPFSTAGELIRLAVYTLPGLGGIWYLLYKRPGQGNRRIPRPGLSDLTALLFCLPGLILLGFGVSALSDRVSPELPPSPRMEPPGSPWGWLVLLGSCVGTGYMEESYFRFYLLQRFAEAGISPMGGILFSTLLFSCCHSYEGFWGVLNAALAGLGLALVFVKRRSLHGIAWAHGGYNGFVYLLGFFYGA